MNDYDVLCKIRVRAPGKMDASAKIRLMLVTSATLVYDVDILEIDVVDNTYRSAETADELS